MNQWVLALAGVMGLAGIAGVVAKLLRQPVILGYILAGMVLAGIGKNLDIISAMGQVGVTLLLFLVGLEMPLADLKKTGRTSVITGLGQIVITSTMGYFLARLLGFGAVPAVYLGVALTFGSTVMVVKLLSEKRDLQSLYGKIATGYLLVQDFVAIGILTVLSGLAGGGDVNWLNLGTVVVKGAVMVGVAIWLSDRMLPKILDWLGRSTEVLFVVSVGWCLVVAAAVSSKWVGFGPEIGGFLAGLALANAAQNLQIVSRVRPLRDFFLTLFFVGLGANIGWAGLGSMWLPAIILAAFVLVGNPLIVMIILGWQGYSRRIAFLASTAVAQVSEFSLIVVALAVRVGHVDKSILGLVGLVAMLTMTGSTYLILHAEKIYKLIGKWLIIFEFKETRQAETKSRSLTGHVVLFGHNRTGRVVRPALEKLGREVVVVDFDPKVVEEIGGVYGDIADYELYEELNLDKAEMVMSTVSDVEDNLQLLSALKKKRPISIILAADTADAVRLYKSGADLVLVPHTIGGEYLSHLISVHGLDRKYLQAKGQELRERLIL
ncbi:MAG: Transporter, CPA2 family [Candidatus Amesbacteria bacterium GW2011_GWA2_47_11b]|uniref:Transporter, CPA2 family n=3 Tax=Candidatus Amesiibacteriota TaxID=1752730 RepID=A0A0G1SJY1_9BACT|nr:MAG: Transporter, CPA2 family [Microgenomates group bacterium GW2011_GWC1_46_20]KKU58422.1 MAG: Transporter, CPA2 family [Candidatus Amesbacteria bacterium GW2011_GWA2_47_11b]KKU69804.1 MAG: Transporter, CPA2 family [Candidatus Amesbacteria bacterium GW2011_GWA1_47_20]KKU84001.1 MAG: Transporter, CPA2 family [Candidatus Amesbacteria bacterium GW2011_GWC2_47_8]